jgi:uncharacterized protein (TIGR03437 family)
MATVNGRDAEVISSLLEPDALGIYEVRIVVPDEAMNSAGTAVVQISQQGNFSNSVTFPLAASSSQ